MKRLFFVVVFTTLVSGCIQAEVPHPPTSVPSVIPEMTTTARVTPGPTITPSPSRTPALPTNTATPQPTMSVTEASGFFTDKLNNNGGCKLPCIWGIQPEEGLNQPEAALFDRIGTIEEDGFFSKLYSSVDHKAVIFGFWSKNPHTSISLDLNREADAPFTTYLSIEVIRETGIRPEEKAGPAYGEFPSIPFLQYYWLPNILQNYGKPAQILLFSPMEDEMDKPNMAMNIILVYSDQGFMVGYAFPRKVRSTTFRGCPSEAAYLEISSWDKTLDLSLEQTMAKGSGPIINAVAAMELKPFEQVSTMTVEEFYQVFQKPEANKCFTTLKDIWLPPKLY